eukprot:364758-Chlamydomonas_euryale.AAC.2
MDCLKGKRAGVRAHHGVDASCCGVVRQLERAAAVGAARCGRGVGQGGCRGKERLERVPAAAVAGQGRRWGRGEEQLERAAAVGLAGVAEVWGRGVAEVPEESAGCGRGAANAAQPCSLERVCIAWDTVVAPVELHNIYGFGA